MSAAVEKLQRSGDSPDLNSFVYATASVPSIRQAFFPLDAQVENKVLAKIQVILSCLYILGMCFSYIQITHSLIPFQGPIAESSFSSGFMEKIIWTKGQIIS